MPSVEPPVTLDAVVADPHLHALFLQHLSVSDSKGFARLLFLVSVEEFKKVFASNKTLGRPEDDAQAHRRQYASKIINKFMSPDAFLDIASENLRILNKSVWSFDLMLYSGLAAKTDLFQDAELAVKKALQPNFSQFSATPSSWLSWPVRDSHEEQLEESSPASVLEESLTSPSPVSSTSTHVRRQRTATTFLTLERVSVLPILEDFIHTVQDSGDEEHQQENDHEERQAGELIEQLLAVGSRIAAKYLTASASTRVTFVGEAEQGLLRDYELRVACCLDAGSFSLADAEELLRTVERIQAVIEADLKVNHFVRFMGSESFKSLVASYQSRLLSPSGSSNAVTSTASDGSSTASDSSMTTLQELFQCMNVASHQPQRIIKEVLHSLADPSNHSESSSDLYHHHAIPDHVEAFFRPSGADVVRSTTRPEPSLFHMTIGNAEKAFYGACLTRYVPLNDSSKLGPLEQVLQRRRVSSRYPILDTLKQRLDSLHAAMQDDEAWRAAFPIRFRYCYDFTSNVTSLSALDHYVDFSMEELFSCLSVEHVVSLATCMLLERQVVLVELTVLGSHICGRDVEELDCPAGYAECLNVPTPYLFGVHSSYRAELREMLEREGCGDGIVEWISTQTR
ncbi:RGS domain [Phytophthora cactorum]|nr:RGS domain [Phytophthora cactorum]